MKFSTKAITASVVTLALIPAFAHTALNRYALILEDPPVVTRFESRDMARSADARTYQRQIEARQRTLRNELATRNVRVTGSVSTVLNAVFVAAPKDRITELKTLPGVKGVVPLRRFRKELNQATQLVNGPAAWNTLGGIENAGKGIKIAILDSGIDQNHPAFKDSSLPMPAGYPICNGSDCAFTSNKVIVARSYVRQLAAGTDPKNLSADRVRTITRRATGAGTARLSHRAPPRTQTPDWSSTAWPRRRIWAITKFTGRPR